MVKVLGPVTYLVKMCGKLYRRHVNQLIGSELQQTEADEELLHNDVTDMNVLKTRAHGIVSENGRGDDSNHAVPEKQVESRVPETTAIQEGTVRPKRQVKPPVWLDL